MQQLGFLLYSKEKGQYFMGATRCCLYGKQQSAGNISNTSEPTPFFQNIHYSKVCNYRINQLEILNQFKGEKINLSNVITET